MKKNILFLLLVLVCLLSACKNNQDTETADPFEQKMTTIYDKITQATGALDTIDPNSSSAVEDMLSQLATINEAFQEMAALEVPEDYSSIEEMADKAAFYMNDAVTLYQEAYSGETYNAEIGNSAKAEYVAAMTYLSYIGQILMGQIPEGATVTTSN